jgi:hypothetical protein
LVNGARDRLIQGILRVPENPRRQVNGVGISATVRAGVEQLDRDKGQLLGDGRGSMRQREQPEDERKFRGRGGEKHGDLERDNGRMWWEGGQDEAEDVAREGRTGRVQARLGNI